MILQNIHAAIEQDWSLLRGCLSDCGLFVLKSPLSAIEQLRLRYFRTPPVEAHGRQGYLPRNAILTRFGLRVVYGAPLIICRAGRLKLLHVVGID